MHKAAAAPVVITRPLAQARALQDKIAALGRSSVLFPLLEIAPLADNRALDAALRRLEQCALVAFVSPNAIDAALARRPDWPAGVPLAVMGEGSRQALAAHGITDASHRIFSPRDAQRTDSQTLLAALDLSSLAGREVMVLRGESGRELLADALRAAGATVTQVAAYRRSAPVPDAQGVALLLQLLDGGGDWLITSSEALQILVKMVEALPVVAHPGEVSQSPAPVRVARLQQQHLIVPHIRIAETAAALGFCNVSLAASGDEGLLAALQFRHE